MPCSFSPLIACKMCDLFCAQQGAPPFHQHSSAPHAIKLCNAVSTSDFAKSNSSMQCNAGDVFRKYARLQSPDRIVLRLRDKTFEQRPTVALTAAVGGYINAYLRHALVGLARRYATERRPARYFNLATDNQSREPKMGCVPLVPRGSSSFEGSVSTSYSREIDLTNFRPVFRR